MAPFYSSPTSANPACLLQALMPGAVQQHTSQQGPRAGNQQERQQEVLLQSQIHHLQQLQLREGQQQQQQQQDQQQDGRNMLQREQQQTQVVEQQQQQLVRLEQAADAATPSRANMSPDGVEVPMTFTPHTPGLNRDLSGGEAVQLVRV